MKNKCAFFITSTGTELGKTYLSEKIIGELVRRQATIDCYKPILSGFDNKNLILNDSAKLLLASKNCDYEKYKVYYSLAFKSPVAPTIAAKKEKKNFLPET